MKRVSLIFYVIVLSFSFLIGWSVGYQEEWDKKAIEAFVVAMNNKAYSLQMFDTLFDEPTGLSYRNQGIATDVIRLLRACVEDTNIVNVWNQDSSIIKIIDDEGVVRSVAMYNTFPSDSVTQLPILGRKTGSDEYIYNLAAVFQESSELIYVAILNCDTESERLTICRNILNNILVNKYCCNEFCAGEGKIPLLSITKLMTILLIKDYIDNTECPIVIKKTDLMRGSGIYIKSGDVIILNDAIKAVLISSSNTCSYAIARIIGYEILRGSKCKVD